MAALYHALGTSRILEGLVAWHDLVEPRERIGCLVEPREGVGCRADALAQEGGRESASAIK
jgi:hypothetical protein